MYHSEDLISAVLNQLDVLKFWSAATWNASLPCSRHFGSRQRGSHGGLLLAAFLKVLWDRGGSGDGHITAVAGERQTAGFLLFRMPRADFNRRLVCAGLPFTSFWSVICSDSLLEVLRSFLHANSIHVTKVCDCIGNFRSCLIMLNLSNTNTTKQPPQRSKLQTFQRHLESLG